MTTQAKVRCNECAEWLKVEDETETVTCRCGSVFAVTITRIAAASH